MHNPKSFINIFTAVSKLQSMSKKKASNRTLDISTIIITGFIELEGLMSVDYGVTAEEELIGKEAEEETCWVNVCFKIKDIQQFFSYPDGRTGVSFNNGREWQLNVMYDEFFVMMEQYEIMINNKSKN
jgi:hypothetical protein